MGGAISDPVGFLLRPPVHFSGQMEQYVNWHWKYIWYERLAKASKKHLPRLGLICLCHFSVVCLVSQRGNSTGCFSFPLASCAPLKLPSMFFYALPVSTICKILSFNTVLLSVGTRLMGSCHHQACVFILFYFFNKPASSGKETAPEECNATNFTIKNHSKELQDGETMKPKYCNNLQERFNALTREKNTLQNENNIVRNMLRTVTEERDRLRSKQTCGRKKNTIVGWGQTQHKAVIFLVGVGILDARS